MKFHELLKTFRVNMNIPQKEIAKRLNVHPSLISRYEDGQRNIVVDRLAEIQHAYNIPDDYFFEMILNSDSKNTRLQPEQAKELQSQYNDALYFSNKELLQSDSFRYFFVALMALPDNVREDFIKKFIAAIDQYKPSYPIEDND